MTAADAYELCRYTNVLLAAAILTVMAVRFPAFARASRASQAGRMVVLWFVATNTYGTLEVLWDRVPAGPRVPTATTALLLTCWWLAVDWRAERAERRRDAEVQALLAVPAPRQPV